MYLEFLKHIGTKIGRLLYSLVPFFLFVLLVFLNNPSRFIRVISRELGDFVIVGVLTTIASYVVLSVVIKIIPNWVSRKDIRMWCFASLYWVVGVFFFVIMFDPYNIGGFSRMDGGEITRAQ